MNRNRNILIATVALLGLGATVVGGIALLGGAPERQGAGRPVAAQSGPTTSTTTGPATTTSTSVPASGAASGDGGSDSNSAPGGGSDPGSANGGGNAGSDGAGGGAVAPENSGQAAAPNGNGPGIWNLPQGNLPVIGNPQFQAPDTTGPSVAIKSVSCDILTVVVVFTASDPSGIADVAVNVKTTNQVGNPNPIKYPAVNQILTGVYSTSFPAGKWQTSMISIGAVDNAGNKTGIDKSSFCSA